MCSACCVLPSAGAHAARMLHRVRRAERMLLSYERCGWLDDTPSRLTGRQVRGEGVVSSLLGTQQLQHARLRCHSGSSRL